MSTMPMSRRRSPAASAAPKSRWAIWCGSPPRRRVLTSIVSDDGIYADFEVDEQTYLNSVRQPAPSEQQPIPVELTRAGRQPGHVYQGFIQSFDNHINTGSGTIRARARFANEDGALVPGMFVSVRMGGGTLANALLVPETRHRQRPEQALRLRGRPGRQGGISRSRAGRRRVDGQRVVLPA